MKDRYVAAIAIAAVGTGLVVYSVRGQSDSCPKPWAPSITALFAPCQALYGALDHAISEPEILRVGLLISDDQIGIHSGFAKAISTAPQIGHARRGRALITGGAGVCDSSPNCGGYGWFQPC